MSAISPIPTPRDIREQKKQLRADCLAKRRALPADRKAQMDAQIAAAFLGLVSYRYAKTVLLYYPKSDEVNTRPIIEKALADGKQVALPRCRKDGIMDFFLIESENDLAPGAFGIPEPKEDCPLFDPAAQETGVLMALPGLAYDRLGYRLGYGRGYYDRYLEHRTIATAGLIYEELITDQLPRGKYDLPVHFIVSEKGVTLVE